jgi:arabinofuranosyltransferase
VIDMPSRKTIALFFLLSALSVGGYLLFSLLTSRIGFPLDDAWIHMTYARNLAVRGEWAFIPGQPSAGSTAPLWSGLLAIGFFLPWAPYLWVYLIGIFTLTALAVMGYYGFQVLRKSDGNNWAFLTGVVMILEWHLVWSAASGMETLLFSLLVLFALILMASNWTRWGILGALIGFSAWLRPDGITLVFPAILLLIVVQLPARRLFRPALRFGLGFFSITGAYLLFNKSINGTWLPNTYYAKQAEYAIERAAPLLSRLGEQALLPLVGIGICLLPGFFFICWKSVREKQWSLLAGPIWALGYLGLYALRLPVSYQHGRYVIPMMPVYFLWGLAGSVHLIQPGSVLLWKRALSKALLASLGIVLLIFWFLGGRAYGRDVALIESEMVGMAKWVAINTEPDALIAAHDIGALGYFGRHKIIDLAGLVSPDVIAFIRDEDRLGEYMNRKGVNYLVTFPGWYPKLVMSAEPVYKTQEIYSLLQGGENMVIYRWQGKP